MIQLFSNNAVSLLALPFNVGDSMFTVLPGTGALFPQTSNNGSDYFLITLEDQAATRREIIRVEGRYGDTFTGITRGVEGTTPQNWSATSGNDTLVDHRVTAETMRLAMELPEMPVLPPIGITVQSETVPVGTLTNTLNFSGAGVTVTGAGSMKTITILGGSSTGTAWIEGANAGPTTVLAGESEIVQTATYSQFNRGMKFMITIVQPINGLSESFELLSNISGIVGSAAEVLSYTKYGRVGHRLNTTISVTLNTALTRLELSISNNEPLPIQVNCTRIQHSA